MRRIGRVAKDIVDHFENRAREKTMKGFLATGNCAIYGEPLKDNAKQCPTNSIIRDYKK